jgi:hypothetical protein
MNNSRRKIIPGEKRTISFPKNIDTEFLNYLNCNGNFSGTLLSLAIEGFKSRKQKTLEGRIEKLENILIPTTETVNSKPIYNFSFDANEKLPPEEEDDVI